MTELSQSPEATSPSMPRIHRVGGWLLYGDAERWIAADDGARLVRMVVAVLLAVLHAPLLLWLREVWAMGHLSDTMLSVATPLVIAGLLYLRRDDVLALQHPMEGSSMSGLPLIALSAAIAVASVALGTALPLALSAPMAIHGFLLWTRGPERVTPLVAPIYMLLFVVPGTHGQLAEFSDFLQLASAETATVILKALSYPSHREGILITTGDSLNYVTEACSGMTTLTALLLYALVLSYLMRLRAGQTALTVATLLPLALLANGGRVAYISHLLYEHGYDIAMGPLHDVSAYLAFGAAYALLYGFMRSLITPSSPTARAVPVED